MGTSISKLKLFLIFVVIVSLTYILLIQPSSTPVVTNAGLNSLTFHKETFPFTYETKFTIIITTFNRQDLYREVLEHYCSIPEVDKVLLIWNNLDTSAFPVPEASSFACASPVIVLPQTENQVENRLLISRYVDTSAIFQVDDDILIHPEDIRLGFKVWRGAQDRLVGYQARIHKWSYLSRKYFYSFDSYFQYSIVTGAAHFVNKRFLEVYERSKEVREFVRSQSCCDDIAMNFIVSNSTGQGPIHIRVPYTNLKTKETTGFKGKSSAVGWQQKRGNAISFFMKLFGGITLKENDVVVSRSHYVPHGFSSWKGWLQDWWTWLSNS